MDLREATFHRGLFTDGCIMIMEGRCTSGVFHVSAIGLAPIESAIMTRNHFGMTNWFGGESTVAYCSQPRLRMLCERNDRTRFVFISDAWLDDQRVIFSPVPKVVKKSSYVVSVKGRGMRQDCRTGIML